MNVDLWMKALRENDEYKPYGFLSRICFQYTTHKKPKIRDEFMDVYGSNIDVEKQKEILSEGFNVFENIWGFKSKSFIAPSYTWNPALEETMSYNGVKYTGGL